MPDNRNKAFWFENKDLLNRHEDAQFLKTYLLQQPEKQKKLGYTGSYVLNVNAEWGYGKTFFLKTFAKQLRSEQYLVAEVNAWEDDHSEDPLLTVLFAINKTIEANKSTDEKAKEVLKQSSRQIGKALLSIGKGIALHQGRRYLGQGINDAFDLLRGDIASEEEGADGKDAVNVAQKETEKVLSEEYEAVTKSILSGFESDKQTIATFKKGLTSVLEHGIKDGIETPLFVFIDELDRCRPLYAIELLERVKHLFDIPDIIFVLATDTKQLSCSIKAVYGQEFDAERYLKRFFNRTYSFAEPPIENFIRFRLDRRGLDLAECDCPSLMGVTLDSDLDRKIAVIAAICKFSEIQLRDIEQCIEILESFISGWLYRSQGVLIQLVPLVSMIVAYHKRNQIVSLAETVKSVQEDTRLGPNKQQIVCFNNNFRDTQSTVSFRTEAIYLAGYLSDFSSIIGDISKSPENANHNNWTGKIWGVFSDELRLLRGNVVGSKPIPSVMTEYPDLIAQAGRLSADIE